MARYEVTLAKAFLKGKKVQRVNRILNKETNEVDEHRENVLLGGKPAFLVNEYQIKQLIKQTIKDVKEGKA